MWPPSTKWHTHSLMLCNTDNTYRVSRYKPYKISKAFPLSFSKLHPIITRNVIRIPIQSSLIFPGSQSSAKGSSAQNSGFCKSSYKLRLTKSRKLINSLKWEKLKPECIVSLHQIWPGITRWQSAKIMFQRTISQAPKERSMSWCQPCQKDILVVGEQFSKVNLVGGPETGHPLPHLMLLQLWIHPRN